MNAGQHLLVATGTTVAVSTPDHAFQLLAVAMQILTILIAFFKKDKNNGPSPTT